MFTLCDYIRAAGLTKVTVELFPLGVLSTRIGELLRLQMWDVMTECVVTRTDYLNTISSLCIYYSCFLQG